MSDSPERPAPLILIVDDFQDNREMYAQYLTWSGYRVTEAIDGEQALELAFALKPDLIVMDLSLPRLDGWEASRRLKQDDRTRAIPIIALTGHAYPSGESGAAAAGCDAFLTKPCLPATLVEQVQRMLGPRAT